MFAHPSILGCCVGNSHEVLVSFLKKKSKLTQENTTDTRPATNGLSHPSSPEETAEIVEDGEEAEDAEPFFLRHLNPTPHVRKERREGSPFSSHLIRSKSLSSKSLRSTVAPLHVFLGI